MPPTPNPYSTAADTPLPEMFERVDLQRIHIHDCTTMNVPSLRASALSGRRAERALVIARPGDVVLLEGAPDPGFLDYLEELGIGPSRDAILTLDEGSLGFAALAQDGSRLGQLAARAAEYLEPRRRQCVTPYYPTLGAERLAAALGRRLGRQIDVEAGSRRATELANRKERMRTEAARLGIPVAPGEIVDADDSSTDCLVDAVAAAVRRHQPLTGGVIVRGSWSTGGADVLAADAPLGRETLNAWLSRRRHIRTYVVEALLPVLASPNVQLWIDVDGHAGIFGVSEQRLTADGRYYGNEYPCKSTQQTAMRSASLSLGRLLASQGCRGPVGVDMMEVPDRHREVSSVAFAETNARMNGSTYALALHQVVNAQRHQRGLASMAAWVSRADAAVSVRSFDELRRRLGNLIYQHGAGNGAIPYDTGLMSSGMVGLVCVAASVVHARDIEAEALARIGA